MKIAAETHVSIGCSTLTAITASGKSFRRLTLVHIALWHAIRNWSEQSHGHIAQLSDKTHGSVHSNTTLILIKVCILLN